MSREHHHCPACGAMLVSDPTGTPLRCTSCTWHLVSLAAWRALPPYDQGWLFYTQSSWPTSELAKANNPYAKGTPAWAEFQRGEQRAAQSAQDGEE